MYQLDADNLEAVQGVEDDLLFVQVGDIGHICEAVVKLGPPVGVINLNLEERVHQKAAGNRLLPTGGKETKVLHAQADVLLEKSRLVLCDLASPIAGEVPKVSFLFLGENGSFLVRFVLSQDGIEQILKVRLDDVDAGGILGHS